MTRAMMAASAAWVAAVLLTGCTTAQVATVEADAGQANAAIGMACNDAMGLVPFAAMIPGAGAIVPFITAGCATAGGLAKLAADPSSAAWLGQLTGEVKALGAQAGIKL